MNLNISIATGMAQADRNKYCVLEHIDEADGDKYLMEWVMHSIYLLSNVKASG
jgi:hypothetical protein